MHKYRVAIIGATGQGDYGHGLDSCWRKVASCEVVAVADRDMKSAEVARKRLSLPKAYDNYRAMLEKERPEIVAVAPRWIHQHHDMALACAEFGCHMYMEKPFCRTLGEADEIIRACEMRHLKLAIAHISRYSPQLAIVNKLIADGAIGEVLEIRARGKEDHRGGGEDLWVLGTHVLDLMRAISGDPVECFAQLFQAGKRVTSQEVKDGNEGLGPLAGDHVVAQYRFANQVMGYFHSKKGAGVPVGRFGLRILGSKGMIDLTSGYGNPAFISTDGRWLDPARQGSNSDGRWKPITSQGVDKPETLRELGYDGGNPAAILDLIEAIEKDRPPLCSMIEGRGAIEMVLAVFESHRKQGAIPMPLENKGNPLSQL